MNVHNVEPASVNSALASRTQGYDLDPQPRTAALLWGGVGIAHTCRPLPCVESSAHFS